MKLKDQSTAAFADLLSSPSPSPGGGAAAAFIGAQGAALVAMVAGLTAGRKQYREHDELAKATLEKALAVKELLILAMDKDNEAYQKVTEVFAMPKDTQEQKDKRTAAMQKALKACTLTPYETMAYAAEGIKLANDLVNKSNTNAICDLGVAALSLKTALDGAWFNVQINLSGIEDEEFTAYYKGRGEVLRRVSLPLFEDVTAWVQSSF